MSNGKRNTVLVTGATGFVGSHLVKRLVRDGWEVHIIVRPQSNLDIIKSIEDKIYIHKHDGTTEAMVEILSRSNPIIVFHLASLFLAEHQPKDIEPLIKSNILFGTQLVEAMVINRVYRMINTGTSWQHYNNEDYNPVCLYAATKQAFENILKFYVETTTLKVITLKLFDTYGPHDPRPKLFNLLKHSTKEQKPLVMSHGEQFMDIVYIDDVINAYIIAAERLLKDIVEKYEDYAVSSGSLIQLKQIIEIYQKITGKNFPVQWGGRPYRPREVMMPWTRGRLLPGWSAHVDLETGIRNLVERSNI